jgi:alkanesulfonate monooxygenase SsuD/methylene tetrahydromethanopterin reductase-like flavin-dependent oxidoreductase (luciferase family)
VNVGITLPSAGSVGAFARHAEDVGLDSVWTGDHLIPLTPRIDSMLTLAQAAATTTRLRVGVGVLILALRQVVWAAKQVASLQALSGGRLLLGVGTGGAVHGDAAWRAVGVPFDERVPRTFESLALLPSLVAGESTQVDGESVTLAPGAPMPPVLIGGGTGALTRAVRLGHGWYPAFLPPAALGDALRKLDGTPPPVTAQVAIALGDMPQAQIDAQVKALTGYGMPEEYARSTLVVGGPEQAGEHLAALFDAGAERVVGLPFGGDNLRQAELLAEAARHASSATTRR